MITRTDGKEFTLMGHNEKTGLFGVVWPNDGGHITIYRERVNAPAWDHEPWASVGGCCKVGEETRTMFRYGKSKTMHWSKNCAKPNTDEAPSDIGLLDGTLAGLKTCKNCWGRTRGH